MSERDFWIAVRQALMMVVAAIEKRWEIGKGAKGERVAHDV